MQPKDLNAGAPGASQAWSQHLTQPAPGGTQQGRWANRSVRIALVAGTVLFVVLGLLWYAYRAVFVWGSLFELEDSIGGTGYAAISLLFTVAGFAARLLLAYGLRNLWMTILMAALAALNFACAFLIDFLWMLYLADAIGLDPFRVAHGVLSPVSSVAFYLMNAAFLGCGLYLLVRVGSMWWLALAGCVVICQAVAIALALLDSAGLVAPSGDNPTMDALVESLAFVNFALAGVLWTALSWVAVRRAAGR